MVAFASTVEATVRPPEQWHPDQTQRGHHIQPDLPLSEQPVIDAPAQMLREVPVNVATARGGRESAWLTRRERDSGVHFLNCGKLVEGQSEAKRRKEIE